jgi:hypothetical protein
MMAIRFRNPWIDQRVVKVRAAAARDYLLRHGWEPLDTADTTIKLFAGPVADSGRRITQPVPLLEHATDYVQRVIELITNLAILEDRPADDVLEEMLGVTTPSGNGGPNGQPAADASPAPTA